MIRKWWNALDCISQKTDILIIVVQQFYVDYTMILSGQMSSCLIVGITAIMRKCYKYTMYLGISQSIGFIIKYVTGFILILYTIILIVSILAKNVSEDSQAWLCTQEICWQVNSWGRGHWTWLCCKLMNNLYLLYYNDMFTYWHYGRIYNAVVWKKSHDTKLEIFGQTSWFTSNY